MRCTGLALHYSNGCTPFSRPSGAWENKCLEKVIIFFSSMFLFSSILLQRMHFFPDFKNLVKEVLALAEGLDTYTWYISGSLIFKKLCTIDLWTANCAKIIKIFFPNNTLIPSLIDFINTNQIKTIKLLVKHRVLISIEYSRDLFKKSFYYSKFSVHFFENTVEKLKKCFVVEILFSLKFQTNTKFYDCTSKDW